MFIPLHDANSLKHIKLQYVTIGLIVANVLVFLFTSAAGEEGAITAAIGLGYIPSTIYDIVERGPDQIIVPDYLTFITYAFLHADFWHIAGNMLFLWVFGDNVEDALGHIKFLIFYIVCAAAGALFHGMMAPESQAPLIGASGAVAGVVAAYLILHPKVKVWILAFGRIPLRIPAWIALLAWIGFQVVMFLAAADEQVSWAAHLGGIAAGAFLVLVFRRRGVPLFDREIVEPRAVELGQPAMRPEPSPRGPWGRQ
ncbi:MAG: rhomboid family intramembrane serine protease [Rhizobiaceae bacterium]|nr:rhomboid family intramembrane serine protease [Rhizobiaceae bacterium]